MKSILKTAAASLSALALLTGVVSAQAIDGYAVGGVCEVADEIYFTDRFSRAIYRLAEGEVTLLAGDTETLDQYGRPLAGYTDGRFAVSTFGEPGAVLPFRDGLLVADRENNVLRYADLKKNRVYTFAGSGEAELVDGSGKKSALNAPCALALGENGEIYVADAGNHAIRVLSANGKLTTLLGGEEGCSVGAVDEVRLSYPSGICFSDGVLYIADTGNHRILALEDGICRILAGAELEGDAALEGDFLNGPAELAKFAFPTAIEARDGAIYVCDGSNGVVRVIEDGYVTTLELDFIAPDILYELDGELYVVDGFTRRASLLPEPTPEAVYSDVTDSDVTDAIRFVSANSLMTGTGEGIFSPDARVSRGMLLTILARLDGLDTSAGEAWYEIGLEWGVERGFTADEPDALLTGEELTSLLHGYFGELSLEASAEPTRAELAELLMHVLCLN